MSTLSSGAASAQPATEVEAFVYQDTDNVFGVETPKPPDHRPQEMSLNRDHPPRTS